MPVKPDSKQKIRAYIHVRGFKLTRQRCLILDTLLTAGQSLSADELYRELLTKHHIIGYVTVYRTLKLLAGSGIARDIRMVGSPTRYVCVKEEERNG